LLWCLVCACGIVLLIGCCCLQPVWPDAGYLYSSLMYYRALVLVTLCYFGTCCTLVGPLSLPFSTSQLKFPFMDFEFPLQLAVTLGLVLIVILLLPSSLEVLLTLMLVSALVSVWLLTHLLYSPLCTGILHTDST